MVKSLRQNICGTGRSAVRLALLLALLLAGGAQAAPPSISASLDRRSITLGETATLRLTFTSGAPRTAPMVQQVPGLTIRYSGQSQQIHVVNGQMTSTVTHSYSVSARDSGEYAIPSLRVEVEGQVLTTPPLQLTVRERPAQTRAPGQPEPAFMRLHVPRTEIYVGEAVQAELQLYVQAGQDIQMQQIDAEGFTVGAVSNDPRRTQTFQDGTIYTLFVWDIPVTAVRSGQLTLGPATATLTVPTGPRNILGRFTQGRRITVESEQHAITARPLPREGAPENFNGAIGRFSLDLRASPTEVAVGDPITLRVQIAGSGTIGAVQLPEQSGWDEFRLYPATSRVQHSDRAGLAGIKLFEQVISPQRASITELPPFTFSFFDPEEKAYRTLTHPAIPLTVHPAAGSAELAGSGLRGRNSPRTEIVHIKPDLGQLAAFHPPLIQRTWFLLLQGIGPLALMASFVWRKRHERLASNPRLQRRRDTARIVRHGLANLRSHATAQRSDDFFVTTFRLLQERIGERLGLPASAITEAILDEQLRPRGLDDASIESLHELFQACNQARYAPQRSRQELNAFIPKIETALRRLQKLPA